MVGSINSYGGYSPVLAQPPTSAAGKSSTAKTGSAQGGLSADQISGMMDSVSNGDYSGALDKVKKLFDPASGGSPAQGGGSLASMAASMLTSAETMSLVSPSASTASQPSGADVFNAAVQQYAHFLPGSGTTPPASSPAGQASSVMDAVGSGDYSGALDRIKQLFGSGSSPAQGSSSLGSLAGSMLGSISNAEDMSLVSPTPTTTPAGVADIYKAAVADYSQFSPKVPSKGTSQGTQVNPTPTSFYA